MSLVILLGAVVPVVPAAAAVAGLTVGNLRVDYLTDPLGIDDVHPKLSWELATGDRGQGQTAYQVQAASSAAVLAAGRPDLWDSGQVTSAASVGVSYGGPALASRQAVFWRVRTWDTAGAVSDWSAVAHWEMGLLASGDWAGQWIADPAGAPRPVVVDLPAQDARYVRLSVSKLGLPIKEGGFPDEVSRLQLAEVEVADSANPQVNLAAHTPVTSSESYTVDGSWAPQYATDGSPTTDRAPFGYTSAEHHGQDLATPVWVQLDLGQVRHFDRIRLYPRTDVVTDDGRTPGFPVDYQLQTAANAAGPFAAAAVVTGQAPPPPTHSAAVPLLAKAFTADRPIASARLYAAGLGVYDARVNGQPVTQAVLQPAGTDFRKRVLYSTYDVTSLVRSGSNTIGVALGNGVANVPSTPGRYEKFAATIATPRLLAQLELTYADGSTARVVTDPSWRTTLGPTTFSNWYGGEDFDARQAPSGWDAPGTNLESWQPAQAVSPPGPQTVLSAQAAPPVQQAGTMRPVSISQPVPGHYVFDLGTNIAGWEQLSVSGPAGTRITLYPGELLKPDGTVDEQSVTNNAVTPTIWDTVTLAGTGTERWHPDFMYHGFRYLEVTGLPSPPSADTITGLPLSAASPPSGSVDTANGLVNAVHGITRQAVRNNLSGIPTDCPAREKLGWLEQDHLVFDTISRNYDVAAYYRQFLRTVADAQTDSGLIPDIAPEYVGFDGGFRDDPNWGSTIVLTAWQLYQAYGDTDTLSSLYPAMHRYFGYLQAHTTGNLVDYSASGLGDWNAADEATTKTFTANYAYHQDAVAMAKISTVLGDQASATTYANLAQAIGGAMNQKFFHAAAGTYDEGTQADDALVLDTGIVPDAARQAVLDHLVGAIAAHGSHLTVGEIALPAVFRVLAAADRDDVLYDLAIQTSSPSYGYQVKHGATALTEQWDGPTAGESQDHVILGAIDAWFGSGLGGLGADPDAVAGNRLDIRPAVVGGLSHAATSYHTPYGDAATDWTRTGNGLALHVTIPVNATATVRVPLDPAAPVVSPGAGSPGYQGIQGRYATYVLGSGSYDFTSTLPTEGSSTVKAADGRMMMFTVAGGDLRGTNQTDPASGFVPWYRISVAGGLTGTPASVLSPAGGGTVQVYARTTDGQVGFFGQSGSGFSTGDVIPGGPVFAGDPGATLKADGSVVVSDVDTAGDLWAAAQNGPGGGWGAWTRVSVAGGLAGAPASVLSPASGGTVQLFARTTDGHVGFFGQSGSGFSTGDVIPGGPVFAGDPAVTLAADNTMVVTAVDTGGDVWGTNQTSPGSGWVPWYRISVAGGLTGRPAMVRSPANNGTVQIMVRTTGGQLGVFGQSSPTSTFSTGDVIDNSPALAGDPALALAANNTMIVTAADSAGTLWGTNQSTVGSWFVPWYRV
ncbi:family 78 glycoside hydrolase catalytic domain [Amycolatopsis sp. NPDC004378]